MNFNVGEKYKFDGDSAIFTIEYIGFTYMTWSSDTGWVGGNDYPINTFVHTLESGGVTLVSEPLKPYRELKKFTL